MQEVVIACSMLEDEINYILQEENLCYEIFWVERNLHQSPILLKRKLQGIIDEVETQYNTIILCFGLCGNALNELHSDRARIIAMRYEDCIGMLLQGSPKNCRNLYFTAGWLNSENSMENEYAACTLKYGEAKTRRIYQSMLKEYRNIKLLDTGAYDVTRYRERAILLADKLNLEYGEETASLGVLRKLLTHDWDEDIVIAAPAEQLLFR